MVGHATTVSFPSSKVSVGAYVPRNSRFHQLPVARFSLIEVNQYCHNTARTCFGGAEANGFPRNSARTSGLLLRSRSSVLATNMLSRHVPSDANHRFQSKRGWYGA